MRQSVKDAFIEFSTKFEGCVPFMYLDIKGLVTCAIGNLVDPIETVAGVPFVNEDGSDCSWSEIAEAWNAVKSRQDMAHRGGMAFADVTKIRLTPDGIKHVVFWKLHQLVDVLSSRFPWFVYWPADAQLGLISMAWAMGPHFKFHNFQSAAMAQDWLDCAKECHMDDAQNPGLRPRNRANKILFTNAHYAKDRTILYYPQELSQVPAEA